MCFPVLFQREQSVSNHNSSGKSLAVVSHGVVSKVPLMSSSGAGWGPFWRMKWPWGVFLWSPALSHWLRARWGTRTGGLEVHTWGQQATALAASGAAGGCGGMRGLLMEKELREDGTLPHAGLSRAPTAFKHL